MTLFLAPFTTKYTTAPFNKIALSDYQPAFEKTIEIAKKNNENYTETQKLVDLIKTGK